MGISGNTVVVGAYHDDDQGTDSGAMYVLEGPELLTMIPTGRAFSIPSDVGPEAQAFSRPMARPLMRAASRSH